MKKLLLSLTALVILGLPKLSAQLINADFETWTDDPLIGHTAKDPNGGNGTSGWWDFNFDNYAFLGSSPITVFQDSANPAPKSGTYCAKIVSQQMTHQTYTILQTYQLPYDSINGILVTAYVDINGANLTFKPGVPFNQRISSYTFWYRYIPNGTDTCSCSVSLYHYSGGSHHLLGGGLWTNHATVSGWTMATVPIAYDSSAGKPDTILIQFSACSLYSPKAGDTMNVDDGAVTGIGNIAAHHDNVNLYPNPAQSQVNLAITGQFQASRVVVYDVTGKTVGTYSMNNNSLTINTQSYNNGIYFYKLLDNTGVELNVGKFSVVK